MWRQTRYVILYYTVMKRHEEIANVLSLRWPRWCCVGGIDRVASVVLAALAARRVAVAMAAFILWMSAYIHRKCSHQ